MEKEQIEKEMAKLRNKLWAIEKKEADEENKKLVGKYFKYRNCYSCPEKPSDYWYLYKRVIGLGKTGLITEEFQIDKDGKCSACFNKGSYSYMTGYTEISRSEYLKALSKFKKRIAQLK